MKPKTFRDTGDSFHEHSINPPTNQIREFLQRCGISVNDPANFPSTPMSDMWQGSVCLMWT